MWFPMDGRDHPTHTTRLEPWRAPRGGIARKHHHCSGGHSERETPGHIPNPEAKTLSADGTARETSWESRTPPDFNHRKAPRSPAPGALPHFPASCPAGVVTLGG